MPDLRFETFGLNARWLAPPKPMGRIHHHHEVELNLLVQGGVTYLSRGQLRRLEPGRLTVFWGSVPHSLVAVEPGSEMAWLTLPLAWVWGWELPQAFLGRLMRGDWIEAPPRLEHRHPVRAWVEELRCTRAHRRHLLLELQACLLLLAKTKPTRVQGRRVVASGGLRHVEKMARFMVEHLAEEMTVSDVAAAAGLHPNYAMPLFRRISGITIRDYLQQHRITRAQQLLFASEAKVIDVALASGFGSLSAFYAAFVRATGETPQGFRAHLRAE